MVCPDRIHMDLGGIWRFLLGSNPLGRNMLVKTMVEFSWWLEPLPKGLFDGLSELFPPFRLKSLPPARKGGNDQE